MNVILDENAYMPTKAYEFDAGYDLRSPERIIVRRNDFAVIDTGVHVEIPKGYAGFLKSKSGLYVKYGIVGEGVIDSGYTGSIVCKLYNHGDMHYVIEKGDKIIQLVILPVLMEELVKVNRFETTQRGNRGFGSSGK